MVFSLRVLAHRSLVHYWRTNAAVVAGVATAVAVLAGALVVGESVRGTLRDLVVQRLGATDLVVTSTGFFRDALAGDVRGDERFGTYFADVVPIIATPGVVTAQVSGRRAGRVLVYGVDDRFWRFHGVPDVSGPKEREAFVSQALAAEIGLEPGAVALVRVERPSAMPLESLHGRKTDIGRTLRLTAARVLPPDAMGDFSVSPQQGDVHAVFVPLERLQDELGLAGRVNTLLVDTTSSDTQVATNQIGMLLGDHVRLDDVGLALRALEGPRGVSVESESGLLDAPRIAAIEAAIESTLLQPRPVLTYLANTIAIGSRSVPYSLVTATDLSRVRPRLSTPPDGVSPIVLNDWAARDLQAKVGDAVRLDYFVWEEPGTIVTRAAEFRVAGIVPVDPADRDLAPAYPGITDSPTLDGWDPPFPLDLRRVRRVDEQYWETYRTTPKAFVPFEVGQRLWGSRHGVMTSLRFDVLPGRGTGETLAAFDERLRTRTDPLALGMSVATVARDARTASAGATDFGQYFLYFSFFLVVAALVLASLFFKLGIEQRVREVGLLRAVGLDAAAVRRLFFTEAVVLSAAGGLLGVLGALGYAWLVVTGLGTWWVDAVGTRRLAVHVSLASVTVGFAAGVIAALVCTGVTLGGLAAVSERRLLGGDLTGEPATPQPRAGWPRGAWSGALASAAIGVGLVAAATGGIVGRSGAFFGAGGALLVAALCACAAWYRRPSAHVIHGRGWLPVSSLGLRNAAYRPGRSVLAIGVIASATFILIAVDAFRRGAPVDVGPGSGVGGYDLLVESLLPIAHDLGAAEGQREFNLASLDGASVQSFRLRPGDDASCLNLYAPQSPRMLGVSDAFIAAGRFAFQSSLATTEAERSNPWTLLRRDMPEGVVPVIADANSLAYVLHRSLGDDIAITVGDREVRLRVVAALRDSVFQRELLMSDASFRSLFPGIAGYRVWLIEAAADRVGAIGDEIENALTDFGADVSSAPARLAEFHRVENAYLTTFQTLGGLGLLLGTVGLAAVLLRNVFERRRELALLRAVGYRPWHFVLMLVAESSSWLAAGLVAGGAAAALAIAPAVAERGGRLPFSAGGALLVFAVLLTGVASTAIAARIGTRGPLIEGLRSE